jgi:hypothetical protein
MKIPILLNIGIYLAWYNLGMRAELGIFVGGGDSQELIEMEKFSEAQGFISPKTESIIAVLKNRPDSVVIRGGLTQYCVADTVNVALHLGVQKVIIDLHYCRATTWDKGDDNNLELRRETLNKGLGRRAIRNPRPLILPVGR